MGWQVDFVQVSCLCESEPQLESLVEILSDINAGIRWYSTRIGQKSIVRYNSRTRELVFKASPIHLRQGHNFSFTIPNFVEAVNEWSVRLGVDLWRGEVQEFEFAAVMECDRPPKEYIRAHPDGDKLKSFINPNNCGRYCSYTDKKARLKLYDAGHRIRTTQNKEAAAQAGWNAKKNYIKFESHYLKPSDALNNGRPITLAELVTPDRLPQLKNDLLRQYKRLNQTRALTMPKDKKHLTTADIILSELVATTNGSLIELRKSLYARINSYPDALLTIADKNARKAQIKALFARLALEPVSGFDLTSRLHTVLGV